MRLQPGKTLFLSALSCFLTATAALPAMAGYLPGRIQLLSKTTITHHGPNCWNAALVAAGTLKRQRFTSADEFRFLVDSAACEKIPVGQQRMGDVQIYVRSFENLPTRQREAHANIWLSEKNSFNKMTSLVTSAYEITTNEAVNEMYARTGEGITFNVENPKRSFQCRGDECVNQIQFRRCGSISGLLKADSRFDEKLTGDIEEFERVLSGKLRRDHTVSKSESKYDLSLIAKLEERRANICGSDTGFFCRAMELRLVSLAEQIEFKQPRWLISGEGQLAPPPAKAPAPTATPAP